MISKKIRDTFQDHVPSKKYSGGSSGNSLGFLSPLLFFKYDVWDLKKSNKIWQRTLLVDGYSLKHPHIRCLGVIYCAIS